jgi:hypothetical protein
VLSAKRSEKDWLKIEAAMFYGFQGIDDGDMPDHPIIKDHPEGTDFYVCSGDQILALIEAAEQRGRKLA